MRFLFFNLVLIFSLNCVSAVGQADSTLSEKKKTLITFHTSGFSDNINHELRVEQFVHPKWSLIYSTSYSYYQTHNSASEFRLPIGCSVGVGITAFSGCYGFYSGSFSGIGEIIILSAMIPDGVAYHLSMGKRFDISPYVNASGLMLRLDSEQGNRFYYAPSAGIRLMHYFGEHFVLSGEQTFRRTATGRIENLLGASISVRF